MWRRYTKNINTPKGFMKTNRELLLFVMPSFLLIMISSGIPFLMNIFYAFTKWNGITKTVKFVGLDNFVEMVGDEKFGQAVLFTLKYTILFVIIVNILAILLAVLLDMNFKTKNIIRSMVFMPYIISLVVVGFIWKMIFTNAFGNIFDITGIGLFGLDWLGDPGLAFLVVLIVSVWQAVGFYLVIYIVGLQSIPQDVLEAATVDGAVGLKKFFKIKLPLLMQSITICVVLSITNSLKIFDIIFTLTDGGPGDTTSSIALNIYNEAFTNSRYGYGTAKALVFFIMILLFTLLQLKFFKNKEVEA